MKKTIYVKPEIEIVEFEFEGIIAASGGQSSDYGMDMLPSDPGMSSGGAGIWDDKWL